MDDKPVIEVTQKRSVSYQIMYVHKANFNDTYYLEKYKFDVNEIPKDRLIWIDPFFGRSKINNTLVAIKYISDDEIIILEKQNDIIKEHQADIIMDIIICEDFDNSRLLACHISLTI